MKPTQEQVIAWAREAGMELYGLGTDRAKFVYYLEAFATLAYEAGRKDENEACAKVGEFYVDASNAKNEPGIALVVKDYIRNIRARRHQ